MLDRRVTKQDVVEVLDALEQEEVLVSLDGGCGVDALSGRRDGRTLISISPSIARCSGPRGRRLSLSGSSTILRSSPVCRPAS
jgi:hypothetical protein